MLIDWENTEVDVTTFGRYQWKKGVETDFTWTGNVSDNHIWLPISGHGQVITHSGKTEFKKGKLFWLRPGFRYHITQNPSRPICFYGAHFDLIDEKTNAPGHFLHHPPEVVDGIDFEYFQVAFERLIDAGSRAEKLGGYVVSENDYKKQKSRQLLTMILMKIEEMATEYEDDIATKETEDMINYIAQKIRHDPKYRPNVKEIAKKMGITSSALCQAFKRRFVYPPNKHSIYWRISHATRLLKETNLSVKEIAKMVGYNSIHLFGRQFKQRYEKTPLQYRKSYKKENSK